MSTSIEQVARLLSEIPYIEAHPGITVQEVARVFTITPAQVRKDIVNVAIYCGLPGGYPSDLIDVDIDVMDDEGVLYLTNPTGLDRPLRLTVAEAASLQLALLAVRSLVPDDTAQAIDALMDKIAFPVADTVELKLAAGDEEVRRVINHAITAAERLELTYDGGSRGVTTQPVIDPVGLTTTDGVVYLSAYCVSSDGWRTYRLDRIAQATPTGEMASSHGPQPDANAWPTSLERSATVLLSVTPQAVWVGEHYPTRELRRTADGAEIRLPVVDSAWLVRLLLSLGGEVRSVDPPQYAQAARELAQQALDNYERLLPGSDQG